MVMLGLHHDPRQECSDPLCLVCNLRRRAIVLSPDPKPAQKFTAATLAKRGKRAAARASRINSDTCHRCGTPKTPGKQCYECRQRVWHRRRDINP